MLVKNLHVLTFKNLYGDINEKMSLNYNMEKPTSRVLNSLRRHSSIIMKKVLDQLAGVEILGHDINNVYFRSKKVPPVQSDYDFEIKTYSKALFGDTHHHVLWSKETDLVLRGCINMRRDIANVCKHLFVSRARDVLGLDNEGYDLDTALDSDFFFRDKKRGDLILTHNGRKSPDPLLISKDAYKRYAEDRLAKLL